ncbi:HPr family phosphocarrier protein [Garciella nitratireducens]|uniref:Phosphocarrier protein HPr n=1 Tax=Garciella nitratireducens DSM 15102 TaxID=1121911 RepID=A0A1T4LGU1_9FIRM|nr:HPr family phosphocarrier protein [Garciella nitratireducens]RBP46796.1 phosphocarrier protein [Garciella nitratireducens]SJZ53791.1 phosphocarrier protein [Garciella nitratireducens DSM 15102]
MVSKNIVIRNKSGLHARPASKFVQTANEFKSDIFIEKDSTKVNAKSIMGVMTLGAGKGSEITLIAEGEDEKKALDALVELIENNFYEE